jgi:hypothetical protein
VCAHGTREAQSLRLWNPENAHCRLTPDAILRG